MIQKEMKAQISHAESHTQYIDGSPAVKLKSRAHCEKSVSREVHSLNL